MLPFTISSYKPPRKKIRSHRESIFMEEMAAKGENLVYEPRFFRLSDGTKYTPDFYNPATNTYYELAGTRQAWSGGKNKIARFQIEYPSVSFKIIKTFQRQKDMHKKKPLVCSNRTIKNNGVVKLRMLLTEQNTTQFEAARRAGVPQPTISRHLTGKIEKVDPAIAIKYEEAFGIPKEEFVF